MNNNTDNSIIFGHEVIPVGNLECAIAKAESGDSEMCYSLASFFLGHEEKAECGSWKVIKRDINEATKWAEKCATLGNSNGYAFLGNLYSSEEVAFKDYRDLAKAVDNFRKGSELGNLNCAYRLANLLLGLSVDDAICLSNRISFSNHEEDRANEALTLYLKVYDEVTLAYYREEIAGKIASCYARLGNLESALEWYKKGYKGAFEEEIRELKTILKYSSIVKELETEYELKPSAAKARKIAEVYYKLALISQNWLDGNEYLDLNRKSIHWLKIRKNQLEEEIQYIEIQITLVEGEASFVRKLLINEDIVDP